MTVTRQSLLGPVGAIPIVADDGIRVQALAAVARSRARRFRYSAAPTSKKMILWIDSLCCPIYHSYSINTISPTSHYISTTACIVSLQHHHHSRYPQQNTYYHLGLPHIPTFVTSPQSTSKAPQCHPIPPTPTSPPVTKPSPAPTTSTPPPKPFFPTPGTPFPVSLLPPP